MDVMKVEFYTADGSLKYPLEMSSPPSQGDDVVIDHRSFYVQKRYYDFSASVVRVLIEPKV